METPVYHSGSLSFTAGFAEPVFELAHAGPALQRAVFHALRDFEMDLAGLQEIGTQAGPASWHLSVSFLSFRANLEVRVSGFKVTFLNKLAREAALLEKVLLAVESAVLRAAPHASVSQREFVHQVHCQVTGSGLQERIPPCPGTLPAPLGDPAGNGIALYFTDPSFSGPSNVVLDRSALLDQGLFVQVGCGFDATSFDLCTSFRNFQSYLATVDRAFHLHGTLGGMA